MSHADLIASDINPLDWFAREHEHHRQMCAEMRELALSKTFDRAAVVGMAEFVERELAQHLIDEERELFPLLTRRAAPDDGAEEVLQRLCAEHRHDRAQAQAVAVHLRRCLDERRAPGEDPLASVALASFASHELTHLALENAVVLPLARLRLSARDLSGLRRRLAQKRTRAGFAGP
jgi:iron-sulfur cluster repair protein YtfE (RIC family)